jgi:hypothetical protein
VLCVDPWQSERRRSVQPADLVQSATAPPARPDPYRDTRSVEFGFRSRRFGKVRRIIQTILDEKGECDILDLGGTETIIYHHRLLSTAQMAKLFRDGDISHEKFGGLNKSVIAIRS